MPRTKKQTKHKKLKNNNNVLYDDQLINNVIGKLKYEILEYVIEKKIEHKTFLKYVINILKISFIVNTEETLIFITYIIKNVTDLTIGDTADFIIDNVKTRPNNQNNIQCDICYYAFINCKCHKTCFICSQCNLVYCFNCFKNIVIYCNGIIKCPNCRKVTDTTLRDSEDIKVFLDMAEMEYYYIPIKTIFIMMFYSMWFYNFVISIIVCMCTA